MTRMTHEELSERLLELAYGELRPREARELEDHVATCEACRAELDRIRVTRRLMSALPVEPAPEAGERILVAAAREAAQGRARSRRFPRWLWGGAVAAASLAAVVAVSYRVLDLRPGPLERDGRDALLGDSPYARAPAPAATAPVGPPDERQAGRGAQPEKAPPSGPPPAEAAETEPSAPERPRRKDVSRARPPAAATDAAAARQRSRAADEVERTPEPAPGPATGEEVRAPPRAAAPAAPQEYPSGRSAAARAPAPQAAQAPSAEAARAPSPDAAREESAPPRALSHYAKLRSAGRLRGEVRTFTDCEGEAWRKVETDPSGRVVRYVREGRIRGQRLRIEHVYGEDGALSTVIAHDLDEPGVTVDADALGLVLPPRAAEATIDAPPRCGR